MKIKRFATGVVLLSVAVVANQLPTWEWPRVQLRNLFEGKNPEPPHGPKDDPSDATDKDRKTDYGKTNVTFQISCQFKSGMAVYRIDNDSFNSMTELEKAIEEKTAEEKQKGKEVEFDLNPLKDQEEDRGTIAEIVTNCGAKVTYSEAKAIR